jgi:hypothetical protein
VIAQEVLEAYLEHVGRWSIAGSVHMTGRVSGTRWKIEVQLRQCEGTWVRISIIGLEAGSCGFLNLPSPAITQ